MARCHVWVRLVQERRAQIKPKGNPTTPLVLLAEALKLV